jgi:manganese oxidase
MRRRLVLGGGLVLGLGMGSRARAIAPSDDGTAADPAVPLPEPAQRVEAPAGSTLVTPNGVSLPYREVGGVKVFHLVAEEVEHTFTAGLVARCWGVNGRVQASTIEAVEGDRVRVYVTNRLPEPTTMHWHGIFVPSGMDGVSGLNQPPIPVGATFRYEFELGRPGTFMYHSHYDEMTQIALGLTGMFVVHPRRGTRPDRDFAIMLHEWTIEPGAHRPNPLAMNDFNVLTMNGKSFPGTEPLVVRRGERVRIRFGNLSPMDHHPIHLHGYAWKIVATDGGAIPPSAQWPETTVLVPTGSTRDVEFVADAPGDWAMHCHMTHHAMNQMGHEFPNMTGADATRIDAHVGAAVPGYMTMGTAGMGDMAAMEMPVPEGSIPMRGGPGPHGPIDMGGMFTILKVREGITSYEDPGWYEAPAGTVAREATAEELAADGIDPSAEG